MFLSLVLLVVGAAPGAPHVSGGRYRLAAMRVGEEFSVATTQRIYRFTVLDPRAGRVSAKVSSDGRAFSPPRSLAILGATHGRPHSGGQMLVFMGVVEVGKRMEFDFGARSGKARALSEPVQRIERSGD